jgi:quercetin dioxygenase-like cupin family protein
MQDHPEILPHTSPSQTCITIGEFVEFTDCRVGVREMSSEQAEAVYTKWNDIEVEKLSSHIGRQFIVGTEMMIARVLMKKDAHVPLHHHENEQITYILEGALKFVVGGKEVTVHAGEVLCIPPNVPHEATALEDTVDLDIFNPPRQDWIDRDDAYLRR